jgi:hypothetical protein
MKRMLCSLFGVFILLATQLRAQTPEPDPDANGNQIITLDMSTMKFDKIFPFDRYFIIHIKNIPSSYDAIHISIIENKTVASQYRKTGKFLASDLEKDNADFILEPWNRPLDGKDIKEADLVQPFKLPPNGDFLVRIDAGVKDELSLDEVKALTDQLNKDVNIAEVINKLAAQKADAPASFLVSAKDELNNSIEKAVRTFNPAYNYNKPELLVLLPDFGAFHNSILNLNPNISLITGNGVDLKKIKILRNRIESISWGTINNTGTAFKDIQADVKVLKDEDNTKNSHATTVSTNLDQLIADINIAIAARDKLKGTMIKSVILDHTYKLTTMNTSYRADFVNNAKLHINLDLGYAYVGRIDRAIAYSGFNIYFRPVDKTIPLSHYNGILDQLSVRTSLLLGISLSSIEKDNVRKGLIDNKALVLGAGFRILSFLKVNGGAFCHYRYDTNPVIDPERYHFSMSPFVSFSLDLDVKPLFTGLSDSIFK